MCVPAKTLLGTNKKDFLIGPLHTAVLLPEKSDTPAPPDPAAERASAEAEAAQSANAQLAANNKRRREQQSLMSKGAPATVPAFTMGDASVTAPGSNTLSATGATTRNTTAKLASLMSRGAPTGSTVSTSSYGGGGATYQVSAR